jgi:uncharacterized membrane protein
MEGSYYEELDITPARLGRSRDGRIDGDDLPAATGTGAVALGWLSLGLAAAKLIAARPLARALGLDNAGTRLVIRTLGAAELALGIGLLRGPARPRTAVAAADDTVEITASVTVNRNPTEVYAFWRDLRNLSRFLENVESIEVLDPMRSRWNVRVGPRTSTWEARITRDEPNQLIAWETLEGADIIHRGQVCFEPAPGNRGTELRVAIDAMPPGGQAGRAVARLALAVPRQQLVNDLRRLKQAVEVGEVIRS